MVNLFEISIVKMILIIIMLIFLLGTIIPLVYIKRKGFDPYGSHKNFSFLSKVTPFTILIWMFYTLAYIFFEQTVEALGFFYYLEKTLYIFIGSIHVAIGYIIAGIGIKELGTNLRIELPRKKTELITSGIFRFIRNPFYLGLYLILIGNFFLIPSVFSIIIIIINFVTFNSKAKDEEKFLTNVFGEKYELYKSTVGKYFPYKIKKRKHGPNEN